MDEAGRQAKRKQDTFNHFFPFWRLKKVMLFIYFFPIMNNLSIHYLPREKFKARNVQLQGAAREDSPSLDWLFGLLN